MGFFFLVIVPCFTCYDLTSKPLKTLKGQYFAYFAFGDFLLVLQCLLDMCLDIIASFAGFTAYTREVELINLIFALLIRAFKFILHSDDVWADQARVAMEEEYQWFGSIQLPCHFHGWRNIIFLYGLIIYKGMLKACCFKLEIYLASGYQFG
ncbi:hypothetical protein ACJX0J_021032, partial [Zea mays]